MLTDLFEINQSAKTIKGITFIFLHLEFFPLHMLPSYHDGVIPWAGEPYILEVFSGIFWFGYTHLACWLFNVVTSVAD